MRGLLGEGAPLSASSIARLKAKWQREYEEWKKRDLSDLEVVYQWADGLYVKAGLEREKATLLVIVVATKDGRKEIVACESGYRESKESWAEVLRDLDRMVTFYSFPKEHWVHLRTTNVVESPFAAIRLRTDAAKRFKRVDSATALIWKLVMVAEQSWRRLKGAHMLQDVFEGKEFNETTLSSS